MTNDNRENRGGNSQAHLAHVKRDNDGIWREHLLEEHLMKVSRLAGKFAEPFGGAEWAALAGLWHDLGKYSSCFQRYIKSASGYDRRDAHIENVPGRVNHSSAGAIYACEKMGVKGRLLAYLIAGHHAGLPDWFPSETGAAALEHRLTEREYLEGLPFAAIPSVIANPGTTLSTKPLGGVHGLSLWIRMLFSCLVDADFLDTESFMDAEQAAARAGYRELAELLGDFDHYMKQITSGAEPTHVNVLRKDILQQCRLKANDTPGLFSLTVPTGGGKTLASMAFALEHARRYKRQRVIYVIPYTSIIEQTSGIFREIFGENIVEHHANLDPDKSESARSRLATENWDAPIIVTTNVQFFESLFAARTSRCRKLHNIVNSIVILDEAQLLPPEFLQPITDVINLLAAHYGVTFLFSTATQPKLVSFQSFGERAFRGLNNVREIIETPDELYNALKRVEVKIPDDLVQPRDWDSLATELTQHSTVLCIVNRRDDARQLLRLMPEGTVHLSALMCGEHRSRVIAGIKACLRRKEPVRVISTQLVEAGVDLDFPVVYRALAGLDSITQAAGRCNREGRLNGFGKVVVFVPPTPAPPGLLRQAAQISVSLMAGCSHDILSRNLAELFFEHLYMRAPSLDKHGIIDHLTRDGQDGYVQFRTAAEKFRLIDDSAYQTILVRYGKGPDLLDELARTGPRRNLMRKLQRYAVNIPKHLFLRLEKMGDVYQVQPGIYAQTGDKLYDAILGVVIDGEIAPDELIA